MLTRKQHELLVLIQTHLSAQGVPPSYDEMKDALGLRSKSGIHRLIKGLEERGFIKRLPHRARAIEVVRMPENIEGIGKGGNVIKADFGIKEKEKKANPKDGVKDGASAKPPASGEPTENVQLPLYGRIAAGTPIEALRDYSNYVDVPTSLIGRGDYYALEVEGDSMIEAGIFDGDTVIIERGEVVENGMIGVALIDNEEATLKRIRRKGGAIALEPANASYETRIFPPERVKIQGRLTGLLRKY